MSQLPQEDGGALNRASVPSPGTGDEATRAAAERLIGSCTDYIAEHGNPMLAPNLYTDAYTVARAVLAGDRTAEGRRLEAIVKEAWRFWAALNESALASSTDRGYTLLRVRTDKYQAFDALFRASKVLAEHEGAEAP